MKKIANSFFLLLLLLATPSMQAMDAQQNNADMDAENEWFALAAGVDEQQENVRVAIWAFWAQLQQQFEAVFDIAGGGARVNQLAIQLDQVQALAHLHGIQAIAHRAGQLRAQLPVQPQQHH